MITSLFTSSARLYTTEPSVSVTYQEGKSVQPAEYEGIPNNISNLRAFDDPNKKRDVVELSNEAKDMLSQKGEEITQKEKSEPKKEKPETKSASSEEELRPGELTEAEKKEVKELKKVDTRVKAHEAAHKAAGGQYIRSGVNLQYTTGPDGQRYAVAGEVSIDVSEVRDDPEATIKKMETVRRAALAPQDPSPTDRRVAAEASQKAARARAEAAQNNEPANPVEETRQALTDTPNPLDEINMETSDAGNYNPEAETYNRNSQENFTSPGSSFEMVA